MQLLVLTCDFELDPVDVPLAVVDGHLICRGSQALIEGKSDVHLLELLRVDKHFHSVMASNLFIGDKAVRL